MSIIMKNLIILLSLFSICFTAKGQSNLAYKPLSSFEKDTTAFIIYNFIDRAECYRGKTLKDIYKELQAPIEYITSTRNHNIRRLYIWINDGNPKLHSRYICWEKENPTDTDLPRNEKNIYEKYKDSKIEEIGVILSSEDESNKKYSIQKKREEPKGYIKNGRMVYRWKTGH